MVNENCLLLKKKRSTSPNLTNATNLNPPKLSSQVCPRHGIWPSRPKILVGRYHHPFPFARARFPILARHGAPSRVSPRSHARMLARQARQPRRGRRVISYRISTDGSWMWINKQIRQATQEKPRRSAAAAAELGWEGSLGKGSIRSYSPCVQAPLHDAAPRAPEEVRAAPVGTRVGPVWQSVM
jgi:hypothetical protein